MENTNLTNIFFGLARLVNAKMALPMASIALLVVLASCATQPGGTEANKPAALTHNGKIASARDNNRVGDFEMFVMKADGTGTRKLATKPAQDDNPAWSPDGRRLAFQAETQGRNTDRNTDIYVMNADGSGLRRITREPTYDTAPSWSPNGTRIAFSSVHLQDVPAALSSASAPAPSKGNQEGSGQSGIYTIRADGTGLRQLTHEPEDQYPDWSPDGKTIAFGRPAKGRGGIYTVNSGGGQLKRLTTPPKGVSDHEPCWSPDGKRIAFSRDTNDGWSDMFMMNADGTHIRNLAVRNMGTKMGGAVLPAFSPDGKKIVFVGWEGGVEKLYVMNSNGTNLRRLTKTQNAIDEDAPDWQPLP
jgi:Tol biopolymer transport system component